MERPAAAPTAAAAAALAIARPVSQAGRKLVAVSAWEKMVVPVPIERPNAAAPATAAQGTQAGGDAESLAQTAMPQHWDHARPAIDSSWAKRSGANQLGARAVMRAARKRGHWCCEWRRRLEPGCS